MDKRYVPESWIGKRVAVILLTEGGSSLPERHGWLRGVSDEGIEFAQQFYSDSLKRLMPEKAKFYTWSRLGYVDLLDDQSI